MFVVIAKELLMKTACAADEEVNASFDTNDTDDETKYDKRAMWAQVELYKTGDDDQKRAVVAMIYERYLDTVFRFVFYRVKNDKQLAHDIVADTFVRMIKSLGTWTFTGSDLGAVLVTIARNLVADYYKSGRYRKEVAIGEAMDDDPDLSFEGDPEAAAISVVTNETLLAAIQQLLPEQRQCITLRFLEEMSLEETAKIMGKNVSSIKSMQHRALRSLERFLPRGFTL